MGLLSRNQRYVVGVYKELKIKKTGTISSSWSDGFGEGG